LDFPAPPSCFAIAGGHLGGSVSRARRRGLSPRTRRAPSWSCLRFGAPRSTPAEGSACLPWDSSGFGWLGARVFTRSSAPVGPRVAPPSVVSECVHSRCDLHRTFGLGGSTLRNPVPPSWFRTTSAVSSASGLRAYCIPLPTLGFVAFLAQARLRSTFPCGNSRSRRFASPRRSFPLEDSPDRRRAVSPPPLPSWR